MESYIPISTINDFTYSPRSLYLHSVYQSFDQSVYHESPQIIGKLNHSAIDGRRYSTARRYLQGMPGYSEKYNIGGKIDLYDTKTKSLIERKTRIKRVYDGYCYQLYAQKFCLEEAGYEVKNMYLHSLEDNRRILIPEPLPYEIEVFESILRRIRLYTMAYEKYDPFHFKCNLSIYRHLSY